MRRFGLTPGTINPNLFFGFKLSENDLHVRVWSKLSELQLDFSDITPPKKFPEFDFDLEYCLSPDGKHKMYRTSEYVYDESFFRGKAEFEVRSDAYVDLGSQNRLVMAYNKYVKTAPFKENGMLHLPRVDRSCCAQIYIPYGDIPWQEMGFRFSYDTRMGYWSNIKEEEFDIVENTRAGYVEFGSRFDPKLTVSTEEVKATPNETVVIKVQLTNPDDTPNHKPGVPIYVKCDKGYMPYRRAYTDAKGVVELPFIGLGLKDKDVADVKFGFRWYSNVASTKVRIIKE